MRKNEKRIVAFLVDPEKTDSDFDEIASLLSSSRVGMFLELAWNIRRQLDRGHPGNDRGFTLEGEVYRKVAELLLEDSRLPKGKAIDLLLKELRYPKPLPERVSFRRAIGILLKDVDGSRLVSAAQRIRNNVLH